MAQLHDQVRSLNSSDLEQVKDTLARFFQKLSRTPDSNHTPWLNSLETILTRFPKSCLTHRNVIESYLVQFFDSENECWVVSAARCCHSLQQVRPLNDKTATAKTSWRQQMALLCASAHGLVGAAFTDAVDIYKATGYFQKAETTVSSGLSTPIGAALAELTSTPARMLRKTDDAVTLNAAQKNSILCSRLKNVLTFVQAMLVEVYTVAKPVRLQMILDVIVRALSITSGSKQDPMKDKDRQTFSANIAVVKIQALRTLDALIVCLSSNLIPYSPLLFRLVIQTLRWSAESVTQESLEVRRACYSTLALWLNTLQCHRLEGEAARGRRTSLEEELLARILDDVTPRTYTVQLTMSNQSMKNLSKKAKRKMANTILRESAIAAHIPGEKNKDEAVEEDPGVVLAALQCLEVLLTTCGIFLKPTIHKKLQDCLVRQCYGLDSRCEQLRGLALCRALEASRLCVPSNVPPPTHHCLQIYSRLATSPHAQISQFCAQALLSVRVSLHAAPPTLTYAPASLEKEKKPERTAPVVSERNREALLSLLGEDKMPPPKQSEDISIILNDSVHRKRKADECDRISLSSQSSNDVEIDESNGVDLDSPETDFEVSEAVEETEFIPQNSPANGKMKLLDFDKKNRGDGSSNIHNLATQMPQNTSIESVALDDDESGDSIEISYDHSGRPEQEVKLLEELDGDNLPSTGETDDIQITCGQTLRSSQDSVKSGGEKTVVANKADSVEVLLVQDNDREVEVDSNEIIEVIEEENKEGPQVQVEQVDTPGVEAGSGVVSANKDGTVNVEDMLADFVDEKA